ncbi:MAG TPA: hypothetical protein VII06_10155 [Chloroflexota bacterium]
MAVENVAQAQEIGRHLAGLLREQAAVRRLWYTMPHGDDVAFWLLTEPIDFDGERALYALSLTVFDRFPDARLRVHVLNPSNYADGDAASSVPTDAVEIPRRKA